MSEAQREPPVREQLLREGIKITVGDRDVSYGDPAINLGCAGELKAVVDKYRRMDTSRGMKTGEREALDQVLTKVARCITGTSVKRDTYIDGANYFAIAGEIALQGEGPKPGDMRIVTDEELAEYQRDARLGKSTR